ncbi:MAG: MopE-related protein [Byssovorax sp.]
MLRSIGRIMKRAGAAGALLAGALAAAPALSGCNTEAFCFANCDTGGTGTSTGSTGSTTSAGTGGEGGTVITGTGGEGGCLVGCAQGGAGGCMITNGGEEICDGLDNDCDGKVDDLPDLDLTSPKTCGTCANNCYAVPGSNWDPASVKCTPSGGGPGTCTGKCAPDYFDLNADGKCDYYCIQTDPGGDAVCNNKDDDCDGAVDEDVDLCNDVNNCGSCGKKCLGPNAVFACVKTGAGACDVLSTKCQITSCKCDPGACFWDADGVAADGCEYLCDPTNNGVEICDGLDNDCDGKIDDNIPAVPCFGAPDGVCADAAHAGTTVCVGAKLQCSGADVLQKGALPEVCNGLDDDCDGLTDNGAMGAGEACGASNLFPCTFGVKQCLAGVLTCVGAIDPQPETCNGQDDNCDGMIDNGAVDAMGDCNVPLPPPAGATSACVKGTKTCTGGAILCVGSVGPSPGAQDTCGVDQNCDGLLTNQPNTMSDVHNCGACGNDCLAGAVHANWACLAGACSFEGCQAGYYDLDGNSTCEYQCAFVSAQEACNGQDDDCDGQVDEGVIAPSPTAVCNVSPSATAPECTSGVTVACVNGGWKCTFPGGVCSPNCQTAAEVCDGLDNNCNGLVNENVPNFGKACASDDGLPAPGHGVCRTQGTVVCNGPNAAKCSAVKADCATLPGGCTELCDGLDNDCDGSVDEPYTNKGNDAAHWVQPAVVRIGGGATGPWIFAYEASRPSATSQSQGAGNGYFTVAPAGATFDKTYACSRPGVLPWANVTPREIEQSCTAIGGRICDLSEWKRTCRVNNSDGAGPNSPDTDNACVWGYNPLGMACTTPGDYMGGAKVCNLGPFDFDPAIPNDQDGLLVTASPALQHCAALWDGYNGVASQAAYDITGNLHELTRCQDDRAICGADATKCARTCCSGTSTVAGATRLCGALADTRRLAGQSCAAAADCCNLDSSCTANGSCKSDGTGALYCTNLPAPATSCRAAGVACTASAQCCNGEPCTGGVCGGPAMVPGAIYPLMGGSFVTGFENGASCSFDFYKVASTFKLYDSGFRCCFDAPPN